MCHADAAYAKASALVGCLHEAAEVLLLLHALVDVVGYLLHLTQRLLDVRVVRVVCWGVLEQVLEEKVVAGDALHGLDQDTLETLVQEVILVRLACLRRSVSQCQAVAAHLHDLVEGQVVRYEVEVELIGRVVVIAVVCVHLHAWLVPRPVERVCVPLDRGRA